MTNLKSILAQFTQDKNTDYETQYVNLGSYIDENFEALCQKLQFSRFDDLTVESKKAALFHAFEEQLVHQACQSAEQIDFLKQIEDNISPYLPKETYYISIIGYRGFLRETNERRVADFQEKCNCLKAEMKTKQLKTTNMQPESTTQDENCTCRYKTLAQHTNSPSFADRIERRERYIHPDRCAILVDR